MKNEALFPHKTFLHQNAIDIDKLPEPLQKRIHGFEELEQDLLATVDDDRERLLDKMEDLSHEIDEDLEEHFESELDNNDEQEEDEAHGPPSEPGVKPEHDCGCKHAKQGMEPVQAKIEDQAHVVNEEPIEIVNEQPVETVNKESFPVVIEQPIQIDNAEPIPTINEFINENEVEKEPGDEEILEGILSQGRHKITPVDLRKKGFKGTLNFKVIVVGKLYLRKGKYDTHYEILRGWA